MQEINLQQNNKKTYDTVHITTEILEFAIGGIATVLTKLYNNKKENELFILNHKSREDFTLSKSEDILKIHIDDFLSMEKLPINNEPKVIFFHSFQSLLSSNLKTSAKKVYVVHSIIPFENHFCDNRDKVSEQGFWRAYDNADEIVVVSLSEIQKMNDLVKMLGKKPKPIRHIYNGIELKFQDIPNDEIQKGLIGYVGRIDYRKGVFPLIENMRDVEEYKLIMATGSPSSLNVKFVEKFYQKIEHQAKGKVMPLGYASGKRLNSVYQKCELIVIPSIYEPFGMTVLEAIQHGKLILASKVDGILEILGEQYPLYFDVCKNGDLNRVLKKYEQMSEQEKKSLIDHNYNLLRNFSTDNMVREYQQYAM